MSGSNDLDDSVESEAVEVEAGNGNGHGSAIARELTADERQKLAALDEALAKFEAQKRWSDVIRTILAKADIVTDPAEKVALYAQAGTMYIERSSNQAEAIKCFEHVLEHDSHNIEAITRLKEMYEKRRDWERLIRVMERETELLDPDDRPLRYVEMAQLATERLRKPEICIDLWQKVLLVDPEHPDALQSLAQLYERAREWKPLTAVLETLSESISDQNELKTHLQKLGMIYADKLSDDEGAVRAFARLLAVDPDDRRAQEQLKRRYVALKAWDQLEEFYGATDRWDELIRVLEREVEEKESTNEQRIDLLFRVARLWATRKDKADRAARAYEKVLELDPDNLQAAEALSPIYEQGNDARKLVGVYEVRLRHVEDPDARIPLLRETGLLYEERLSDPAAAFERFIEAFKIDSSREVIREDVERLADVTNGWDRVVRAYEEAIAAAGDDEQSVELRMHYGRVLARVGQIDEAIAQFRAVYETQPDYMDAIAALGELYRHTERYKEMLEIYERRMALESDPESRRQLAYAHASLWENELANPDQAIDAYRSILKEWGDDERDAYRALDRLYESERRYKDLAATLERRIDLGPETTEELASLKFRLGRTFEKNLGDKTRAVTLYREVLTLVPEHDGAREALESLLSDPEIGVEAGEILEPIYEARGDWEKLIRALEVLYAGSKDKAHRLALLTKVAEIYSDRLNNPDRAFASFGRALREAPDSEETLTNLEVLAVEQERFRDLVELVAELASEADNAELGRSLWLRAADMYDTQVGDVDGAVYAYRKVLDQEPADVEVLDALESLFRRTEKWRELLGILRRRAELARDPLSKEQLLAQMAVIHDEMLGEPSEAIRLYRETLEFDPTSQRSLAALDQLFERQEMWTELADNIDRQLAMTGDPDQQIRYMLRLAALRETRMRAVDAAIEIYREVLDRDPSNEAALHALERLLEQPDHQLLIAEVIEPLYRDSNEFHKLIGVHTIQARHASSPERRVELMHRIAELYEVALDDPESAFRSHAQALGDDPANPITQTELERLARATGGTEALAAVYEQRVRDIDDPQIAAALHLKAAEIREEQLGDTATAIRHYQRVLELDPQHLDAATALERLFHVSEQYEELAAIHLKKAGMLESPDEQKAYLFRAASIYEEILERPTDAIRVYGRILEVDPEELGALDKLVELYLRLEDWPKLLEIYTRKADIVVDPDEKKRLYAEVGAVYERELGDVQKAIDTYQRILEIDPDDLAAVGRLDALYQATSNWQELLSVLEREADLASDPIEVISYRYRIGDLWHRKLDDELRAVEIYREILEVSEDHEPTLSSLEAIVDQGKESVAAALVLEPVYRGMGEWSKLIAVNEVQIEHERDPLRKVELFHQIAELYEFQLDQPERAFDAYARALPFDNQNDHTLGSLERLGEQLNKFADVTRLYDVEVQKLAKGNPDRVVDLALRTAMLYEVQLGDVDTAIERYQLVVNADSNHTQAIEALDRLYEAAGRYAELADILQKEVQVAASPDDVLNLQFRLGQVYQEHLDQVDLAIEQYREILAAAPEHNPALSALELLFADGVRPLVIGEIIEPLYRMQEAWDRLLSVHEVQLKYQSDADERVAMMHRIAEIAEERAGDHERAFVWMQRAMLEDPMHDHSNREVERLAHVLDGWPQLANTYADVLEASEDSRALVHVGKRLARVYDQELADVQRAEETYRFVLGVDGNDEETLDALDKIYEEHGAHEALAEILRRRISASESNDDLVELNYRLGQVLENELGRTPEAIRTYQHVLAKLDAQHTESIRALEEIYTRLEDWPNLYKTFEKELEVAPGDAAQSRILARMARIASERLGESERAIGLWQRVLDVRGEDPEALNALGDIYASHENWRDLVEVLEREVAIADDDQLRLRVYADLGRIWYEKLERDRNALESWERVLDIDPSNTDALFHIAEIYRAGNQYHELVDTLNRLVEVGAATLDDTSLENVYMQLGELYSAQLQQPMDAVDAYRRALDLNHRNFAAMDALERIHRTEGQWEDAISVLQRRANVLDDPQGKIDVLLEIARIWDAEVGDRDRGASAYQSILETAPMHALAFGELEQLHRGARRWEELIEIYLARVEATEDVSESVGLLRKVAAVYEKELDDRERAFDALQIAWQQDYSDPETARELERIAGLTQKWNELLTSANEALAQVTEPDTKIAICLHCAKWYGQELGHPEYAIPYFKEILQLDPANVPAMRQMAELYRTTKQWPTLAQILGRLVEMTDDPREKADTYVQMGDLAAEHLGVPEQSGGYYLKALEVDRANIGALSALERIYRQNGNWEEFLDVLRRKADALKDSEETLEARLQIAEAYEDRIQDPDAAIDAYRRVLETDSRNLTALRGLERLYAQRERWQDLLEILQAQYEVVTTEKERISILTRLASMWEEEFVKPDRAAERLEQVLEIDPTHEGALSGLARLYRQMQRWDSLIGTYERHVNATPDRAEKVRLYKSIGEVYGQEIGDADRAVDAYLNVLSISDRDTEALDSLTRLYEKRGEHSSALDTMEQLARHISDPAQLIDLRYRMGRILDEHLGDRAGAIEHYQRAIDVEPGHLPSLEAMRKIYIDSSDWLAAARTLEQESEYEQNPRLKARLLVELGRLYDDRLDEHVRAIESFEMALKHDDDNEDAALPLVHEYFREERYGDAFPLLQMLVKRSSKRDAEEQHQLAYMLGETSSKLGNNDEAIKAFTKAYQLQSTHLPSLLGLAGGYYSAKDWEKAFKFYQMLLVHHRDSLGRDEITDIFYRLGVIKREQGERRKALNMFDKALEENAQHRPTLEAIVGLYETQNEWEQVIHFKKQILDVAENDEERFALLEEIGDLWREKLSNLQKAIQSYVDATDIKDDNHKLLHKLLLAYQETRQWEKALETIQRISDLDERPQAKSKYAYTIAVIMRDELKDSDAAVAKFNDALDLDPDQLKAFEAINKILTQRKDWKQLERAFRKMLHRIVGKGRTELEINLWHNLGVIYRDRQAQFESAAEAFKMSSSLQPENATEHQILAELYAMIPTKVENAIEEHQWLLRQDPYRVDSYRALYKLYFDARAYDKAWCLAATLTFLKKADAEQQQFYTQYKQQGIIRPQARIDNERWVKDLFHPDTDLYVSKIFEALGPAVHAAKVTTDKALHLHKKYEVDPATSTVTFARTFGFVAQVLNLQIVPRLFLRTDAQGGLMHVPGSNPPATVCGASLLSGFSPQDLAFVVGRHLSYYRREHFIRTLLTSSQELKVVLLAGMRIAGVAPPDPQVEQTAQQLASRLQPVQLEALRTVAKRFVEEGARTDIKNWAQTVELTGCRAGFLLCNELETAARMIQALPPEGPTDIPAKDKVKEVVLFSVSESYFRLREALGIQIKV